MTAAPAIRMINAHAEGELGYVAIDGVPEIPGRTIADRLDWLNSDAGIPLRRHLMLAPRANPACSVNLLVCLLYTSPSPRDQRGSRMPSSA